MAKKNRKKFVELLQKSRDVTAKTSYEKAAKLLGSSPAWEAMDDATRRQCFDIFVDQLKIQAGKDGKEDGNEEDEEAKKKEKKKEGKTTKKRKQDEEEEPPKKTKKKKEEPSKDEEETAKKKARKK